MYGPDRVISTEDEVRGRYHSNRSIYNVLNEIKVLNCYITYVLQIISDEVKLSLIVTNGTNHVITEGEGMEFSEKMAFHFQLLLKNKNFLPVVRQFKKLFGSYCITNEILAGL